MVTEIAGSSARRPARKGPEEINCTYERVAVRSIERRHTETLVSSSTHEMGIRWLVRWKEQRE